MKKSELRAIYLDKRRELPSGKIAEMSRLIAQRLFDEFDFSAIKVVHCFISIPRMREIDTSLIYKRVWTEFPEIQLVVPRIDQGGGGLECVVFRPGSTLIENRWGISEPADQELISPFMIDAVLVPLLCYDLDGDRVGYGKGYYDRFLRECRPDCMKIGLSFFEPVEKINDADNNDVRLNYCLTPQKIYTFSGN